MYNGSELSTLIIQIIIESFTRFCFALLFELNELCCQMWHSCSSQNALRNYTTIISIIFIREQYHYIALILVSIKTLLKAPELIGP